MTLSQRIRHSVSWQSLTVGGQALTQCLVMAILARLLEPADFGLMAAAQVFVTFAQLICEGGFGAALVQRKELSATFTGAILVLASALGVFLCVTQWFFSGLIADAAGVGRLEEILPPLGLVFIFFSISKIPESLLQREMMFRPLARAILVSQVAGYALPAIMLAYLGFGVWALVIGSIAQTALRAGLLWSVMRKAISFKFSRKEVLDALRFGIGLTQIRFWNFLQLQGDRFIIGRQLGASNLGYYSLASQLAVLPSRYLGDVVETVLFPVLARRQERGDDLWNAYLDAVSVSTILMGTIAIFLIGNSESVVAIVLGEKWKVVAPLFAILCLSLPLRIITRLSDAVNRALAQLQPAANRKMMITIVFLLSIWIAAPMGVEAIAWTIVGMQIVSACVISQLAWVGARQKGARNIRWIAISRTVSWVAGITFINIVALQALEILQLPSAGNLLLMAVINTAIIMALFWRTVVALKNRS